MMNTVSKRGAVVWPAALFAPDCMEDFRDWLQDMLGDDAVIALREVGSGEWRRGMPVVLTFHAAFPDDGKGAAISLLAGLTISRPMLAGFRTELVQLRQMLFSAGLCRVIVRITAWPDAAARVATA